MSTDTDAQAALELLNDTLLKMDFDPFVAEIKRAIATGTLSRVEVRRGKTEEAIRAYSPMGAYLVAVRLLLAGIDPLLMTEDAREGLADFESRTVEAKWLPDHLQGGEPSPHALEASVMPSVDKDDLSRVRNAALRVLALANEIEGEVS
jgi:hypothetical protein